MDSVEVNQNEELVDQNEECIAKTCADHLLSLGSPDTDDIFGEQQALPRVGDQYQVEIPSLMTESERLQMRYNAFDNEYILGFDYVFGVGLPIPVMWVQQVGDRDKHGQQDFAGSTDDDEKTGTLSTLYESSDKYKTPLLGSTCKVEFPYDTAGHSKEFTAPKSTESAALGDHRNLGLSCLQQNEDKGFCPLPGSPVTSWSDAESQSFLLGLYIFWKKFISDKKIYGG